MPAAPVAAYVALGSNLGDREANIRSAVMLLDKLEDVAVKRVSTLFENPAVGGPAGAPDFLPLAAPPDAAQASVGRRTRVPTRRFGRIRSLATRGQPRFDA